MPFSKLIPIFLMMLVAQPARACLGHSEESTIFFDKIPSQPKLKYDLAAIVKIDRIEHDRQQPNLTTASGLVTKVLQGNVRVGDRIRLRYEVSSCGPNERVGKSGLVIAKRAIARSRKDLLSPYTRRFEDNKIDLPRTGL